ncbi:MAG TPA: DUF1501 domain-containing protein [Planctomycetaceae bacterium]|jgi:hypothetical protein|nr:DUF1501 domain-containing protein [Planctomycetaceae bacterium]
MTASYRSPPTDFRAASTGGPLSRRDMLRLSGLGFGSLALQCLLAEERAAAAAPRALDLRSKPAQFAPQARAVIMLMQNGGPSQMELFDPKADLEKFHGKQHSLKVEMFQTGSEQNTLMKSVFAFRKYGQCGMDLSEVIPHIGSVADDLCLVRSMHTEHNNHTEALIMFNTGRIFQGKPSLGAWISYALGTENQNLPAYVVLRDPAGYNTTGSLTWSSGWLPALYRGTEFSSQGAPILNLKPAKPQPEGAQSDDLEFLGRLNRIHQRGYPADSELETRIQNYELAARMQMAAGELVDVSRETEATKKLYGLDKPETQGYGLRCLMARKLVEAGVRFVQIFPRPFQPWDTHSKTKEELGSICAACDQPSAALITDLKQRGLLNSTIVLWSGEFGRLPVSQNGTGRDHNRNAFSLFLAGGGFRAGHVHGETDEVGYKAAVDRVSVPDLHATVLNQLGLDHQSLTFEHSGRDESLTDASLTGAKVVEELLTKPGTPG